MNNEVNIHAHEEKKEQRNKERLSFKDFGFKVHDFPGMMEL